MRFGFPGRNTRGEMMIIAKTISSYFHFHICDVSSIMLVSRLIHKNLVYKVETIMNKTYAVKVFLQGNTAAIRFRNELVSPYILVTEGAHFQTMPYSIAIKMSNDSVYGILVRPWVSGTSYTEILGQDYNEFMRKQLPQIRACCEDLWNTPMQIIGPNNGFRGHVKTKIDLSSNESSMWESCDVFQELLEIYISKQPACQVMCLVNNDFSLHEFITDETNALFIIDWEGLCIGNPYSDIAGVYFSFFQRVVNLCSEKKLYELTECFLMQFKVKQMNDFIHFWVERILLASLVVSEPDYQPKAQAALKIIRKLESRNG